jgi:uncharacterized caspase-like protein
MFSRVVLILGLLVAALLPASGARAERRVALVVGNSAYANATVLRNPRNDASDLADALKRLGFEVLLGLDLDQAKFAGTIEQFARMLDQADVGMFFYAGHGLQLNEKNYLVSTNARLESEFFIPAETIELDVIIRLMESKAATNLVFLDACRNNPLTENLKRNLAAVRRGGVLGRGLARVEPTGHDTLIAFAAAPGQEAADGEDRNSPFTSSLLKHIAQPGLEVSVMLKEVAADVRRDTRNGQRPQQLSDMSRTFYFAKAEPAAAAAEMAKGSIQPAAPVGDDRAIDVAFWSAAQAANECEAVRAYQQRFPNGNFIELAKLAERRLCAPDRRVTLIDPASPGRPQAPAPTPSAAAPPAAAPPSAALGFAPASSEPAAPARPADPGLDARPAVAALPDASTTPSAAPAAPGPSRDDFAGDIQRELIRLGCASGEADGKWGRASRDAVRRFNRNARAKLGADEPDAELLAALRSHDERVCPEQCGEGYRASRGSCVAIEPEPERRPRKAEPRPEKEPRQSRPAATPTQRFRGEAPTAQRSNNGGGGSPLCQSPFFEGGRRCCTFDPPHGPSRIICQ